MKTCSQIEFTAREKKNDEAFEWTSFLLQGIRSGATHERSCLLLKRNVDAARGEEMERRAQLSQDANAAREEAEKKSLFMDQVSQDSQQALETLLDTLKEIEIEKEPATQKQLLQNSSGQILYLEKVNKAIHDLSALESGALHPVQKQFNMEKRWSDGMTHTKKKPRNGRLPLATALNPSCILMSLEIRSVSRFCWITC